MYGLTETSGIVSTYKATPQLIEKLSDYYVPIGQPLDGALISFIDEDDKYPNGEGELYVASPSIGLNISLEGKYYKTGDLAKYDQEGNIILVGRKDRQIKIAGKRIHLLEIDIIMEEHDLIDKCFTIFEPVAQKLISFIKPAEHELDKKQLAYYAKTRLSYVMIPSEFHFIDIFPLTSSRKLDYKKLMEIYTTINLSAQEDQRCDIYKCKWEKEVYKVFSEQLQIHNIKPNDNLFELGVDSLKIAVGMAKITNKLSIDIRLAKVFANPSIRQLASIIKDELALLEERALSGVTAT